MLKKRLRLFDSLLILTFIFSVQVIDAGKLEAQRKNTKKGTKIVSKKLIETRAKKTEEEKKKKERVSYFLIGAGGVYFQMLGDIGEFLRPGFSGRGFVQYNGIIWNFLGLEVEGGYVKLKDKDYPDDGIQFIWGIPSIIINIPIIKVLSLQLKGGSGAAYLSSTQKIIYGLDVNVGTQSIDITASGGIAIMLAISNRFVFGIEGKYYHFFDKASAGGIGASVFLGIYL